MKLDAKNTVTAFILRVDDVRDPFDEGAPFPNGILPANRISNVAKQYLGFWPDPNYGDPNTFATSNYRALARRAFAKPHNAQFRVEFFNVFNHPIIANPYGSSNTSFLGNDISSPQTYGGGGATPDVAAGNPIIGSGSSRVMQLGLKFMF